MKLLKEFEILLSVFQYFQKHLIIHRMKKNFAPAFNNVALDGEGFIFAVTYDSASQDSVHCFFIVVFH